MDKDKTKHLIPCFKGIDAYDMPKEFAKLQAQDLGKVGSTQDLLRGIEKILGSKATEKTAQAKESVVVQQAGGANMQSLLKRGNMALEDSEWEKAENFANDVLNMDAECAEAYLILAMASAECVDRADFEDFYIHDDCQQDHDIKRLKKYASGELSTYLEKLDHDRAEYVEEERKETEARKLEWKKNVEKLLKIRERLNVVSNAIAAGHSYMVGLKSDGTVVATGDSKYHQCAVSSWRDIVAVSAGSIHTVGLKADGTVVATGASWNGLCDVSSWRDIVAASAGYYHTVGLKADGTVVATGNSRDGRCDVSSWRDIVAVSAGYEHTVGLKADGTVVATGKNNYGQCDVSSWRDIVAVSAGYMYTAGLKADGTVVVVGAVAEDRIKKWKDIVAISCDSETVGLKLDGTVVTTSLTLHVSDWTDIVAISCATGCIVGLKSDGTVVSAGHPCDLSQWKLFDSLDTLEEKRKAAAEKAEAERKATAEKAERERKRQQEEAHKREEKARKQALAQEEERKNRICELKEKKQNAERELENLKGLFTGKRRKELQNEIQLWQSEIDRLQR
jgi:hypothetical protein